jgi:hypothetical protein
MPSGVTTRAHTSSGGAATMLCRSMIAIDAERIRPVDATARDLRYPALPQPRAKYLSHRYGAATAMVSTVTTEPLRVNSQKLIG